MANDRENIQQNQTGTGNAEHLDRDRNEQFNELSELSLEERMAVADQIGVPVNDMGEAVATGTMQSGNDAADDSNDQSDVGNRTEEA